MRERGFGMSSKFDIEIASREGQVKAESRSELRYTRYINKPGIPYKCLEAL